jgi:peptidoglycan hydrolase-like protein with peptidoglycan-binding domain
MEYRGSALDFGEFLERTVGRVGYILGTRGELCTPALRMQKAKENPDQAAKILAASKWDGLPVGDCLGWEEMYENGGDVNLPVTVFIYPDRRTFGDYDLAKKLGLPNGPISTLPKDLPDTPIAVGYYGHVGYFYKGEVYQSAGHVSGTIITKLGYVVPGLKPWEYWYQMPYLDYSTEEDVMLKKGDKDPTGVFGPVSAWQQSMLDQGIKMIGADGKEYGVDGSFGTATANGTMSFQTKVLVAVTGVVDDITMGKMDEAQHTTITDTRAAVEDLTAKNDYLVKQLSESQKTAFDRKAAIDAFNSGLAGLKTVE